MIRMDENTIEDHASSSPIHKPGIKNKQHPCVLRGSQTGCPYLQVSLLHDVPYRWVIQFAERLEHSWDEELPHKITWTDWQMETHLAMRSEMRRREKAAKE